MTYNEATEMYLQVRNDLDAMEREHKRNRAKVMEKLQTLEGWITAKAHEDGIETIKTAHGTAYWSTHHTATVGSREEFFSFCKENDAWDMVESRASKSGVKSYIEATGAPPPGVNFSSTRVFNFRMAPKE